MKPNAVKSTFRTIALVTTSSGAPAGTLISGVVILFASSEMWIFPNNCPAHT
ncbi:unannotated protein [freshwater metagenome]|uniref:Unannotated protein n=1 Tax=freshwater metagenome TaxID=449393 RepID=A0A6J7GF10_9ZZZZ